jgi:hypothetical protein
MTLIHICRREGVCGRSGSKIVVVVVVGGGGGGGGWHLETDTHIHSCRSCNNSTLTSIENYITSA